MDVSPVILLAAGIFGAAIGSFITLITYRLPRDEPIGMTRSRCPQCLASLGVRDLVPVLSWALHRGRCRHCKCRISMRYPLTELACALGTVAIAHHSGLTLEALALAGLWLSVVALFITDFEHQIILDEVQIAIGLTGVLFGVATNVPYEAMVTGCLTGLAVGLTLKYGFLYLRNKDGLGLGDVKFLAMAGIWLADGPNFIPFLFISGVLGVVTGTLWRVTGRGEHFPFGPSLAVALLACVLIPQSANGFWTLYGLLA